MFFKHTPPSMIMELYEHCVCGVHEGVCCGCVGVYVVGVWCTWRCMLWVCSVHGGVCCGCVVYMEVYVVGVWCTWRCMLWVCGVHGGVCSGCVVYMEVYVVGV